MCSQERSCGEVKAIHKEYTKIVKEGFGIALAEALPQFRLSRLQRKAMGGSLYQHAPCSSLTLFIALVVHNNSEDFNVDVGFSRDRLCPEESFFVTPNDTFELPSVLFRLAEFRGDKDPGWVIEEYQGIVKQKERFDRTGTIALPPEEYVPRVAVLIADAISKLQQDAVPYFAMARERMC